MLEMNAGEAETAWKSLLDRVEQGEEVVITRDGKPVAQLSRPQQERIWTEEDKAESRAAYQRIRARAQALKMGPFDWERYKAWRDEGRP